MRSKRWAVALLTVVGALLWIGGCLESREAILGRYDAPRDEFVFLNLYQRIGAEKPADLDHLQRLYENRGYLITPPIPNILGKTSFLRLSNSEFATLNLGSANSADVETTPLPLDQVTVKPGKFFLRGSDALCYYDQVVVPGAFADKLLAEGSRKGRDDVGRQIADELARRRDGGKTFTWDELRAYNDAAEAKPDQVAPTPMFVVSAETLALIQQACAGGTVALHREMAVFSLVVPTAANDATEAIKTFEAMKAKLRKNAEADSEARKGLTLLEVIEVTTPAPGQLRIAADATKIFERLEQVFEPLAALETPANDETAKRYSDTASSVKARGIPVDEQLTVNKVVSDFTAGTLQDTPVEKPVAPGKGIVSGR